MSLPFLKPKAVAGVIISRRKPDGATQSEESMEGETDQGLMSAAEDLIRAIHAKDGQAVTDALQAAFEIMESQPHEEGEHISEEEEHGDIE